MDATKSKRHRVIDERLESYRPFWDGNWGRDFLSACDGSSIYEHAFDLSATWKATSNFHSLPFHFAQCVSTVFKVAVREYEPRILTDIRHAMYLLNKENNLGLTIPQRNGIMEFFGNASSKIKEYYDGAGERFDQENMWGKLCRIQDFGIAIESSEVNAYASLVFAYEDFLFKSVRTLLGCEDVTKDNVCKKMRAAFSDDEKIVDCWTNSDVMIARLARHAIAHNGCKATTQLKNASPRPFNLLPDGRILIMCEHVTGLYKLLKDKAMFFARHESVQKTKNVP